MTQFIQLLYQFTVNIGFPSYALAIVLLGVVVRILLFPLNLKQMKSTIGMSEIQPQMQELQKKYANNREKLNEEMMKLNKEYDVNPAAGCLPMLIQMPILYALFTAMRQYSFDEHASFFWINSLNDKDHLYILPVLLAIVTYLTQRYMMPKGSPMADNPSMKVMLYTMPIMMLVFSINFPSGLCLYWVTTSTLMVFQQLVMNKQRTKEMARRALEREKRAEEREELKVVEKSKGQNPSKRKTQKQIKQEQKARKRGDAFDKNNPKATYTPPKK